MMVALFSYRFFGAVGSNAGLGDLFLAQLGLLHGANFPAGEYVSGWPHSSQSTRGLLSIRLLS